MLQITLSDSYSLDSQQFLKMQLDAHLNFTNTLNPTAKELEKTQVLLTRSHTAVNERLLELAPHLQVVGTATSGCDHIDKTGCHKRGIHVFDAPEANAQSTAEHTLLLILSLLRKFNEAQKSLRTGNWRTSLRKGGELHGRWVGVVGLGRVGTRVARGVQAFGAQVIAYDPYIPSEHFTKNNVTPVGFTELLKQSEVLTLHVPLTKETKNMFNHKSLGWLNESCFLVNTSRGEVLNENDLVDFLCRGKLAGAALDVYHHEPFLPNAYWLKTPNLLLSPHLGAFTKEAFNRASMDVAQQVVHFFQEKRKG